MTTLTVRPEATATVTVIGQEEKWVEETPAYTVTSASSVVYSETFASGTGGWTAMANTTMVNTSGQLSTTRNSAAGAGFFGATRTVTGLTIGRTYTLSVSVNNPDYYGLQIGVSGIGKNAESWPLAATLTYDFTANSTSHVLEVSSWTSAIFTPILWDNITLSQHGITQTIPAVGHWTTDGGIQPDLPATNAWATGAGSGWIKDTSSGTLVIDETNQKRGTGALRLGFPASGDAIGSSKPLGTVNLSQQTVRVWVRSPNWSALAGAEIRFYSTASVWDSPAAYFTANIKSQWGLSLVNNEWVELSIPRSAFTTVGAANWASIKHVQVWAYTHASGGAAGEVWVNYFQTYPSEERGLVSIVFDDGWANGTPVGEPLMSAKGWKGSTFVIPSLIGTPGYVTQAHIDSLAAKGWDIGGHGEFNLSTLSASARKADIAAAAAYLEEHDYKGREMYAYPNGANNDAIRADVAEHFQIGRTIDWANQPTGFRSHYRVNGYSISDVTPLADLKALVDAAATNKEHFILVMHRMETTPSEDISYATSKFSELLNYIATKAVDVVPLSTVLLDPPVLNPSLKISQGKVRLDENYSPYVTANFTVPLTSLELLEQIDPRNPQRVTVTTTEAVSGDTRTYNLGLRSRTVDHGAGTIDIELASDEILLHDRKHVATTADSTARQYETSLRAVCNWALGKVGATLAPGTADADMTAAWDATNLQTNPTAGQNTTGWVGSGGTVTRINTGTWPESTGIGSAVRVTMTAGATGGPYFEGGDSASVAGGSLNVSIREKQLYRVSAWVRTSVSKSIRLSVQQRNSAGALAGTNRSGPAFTTTANTWHRLSFVVQAYPGASRMGVYAYLASGTYAAGQTVDITGVTITEGTLDHTYFDGGTPVRPDLYAYSWNDAAHLSTSERRAHVVRRPELFDWTPGQSLFDFLQPLINASGLRLFCDETRTWRLVDPAEYEVPGYVVAQTGHNATEGTDSITRNDDTWADAVVVKYVWTGADGETKSQYDIAGDPNGKTITREIEREYPGPGAAAAILASYEGRGRTQSVTVVGQYLATPGMDVTVNLPGTLTQTGKVRAVELDLGSGLNRIETRGLTDALAGSWILWDPDQTWAEVDPGLLWKDA